MAEFLTTKKIMYHIEEIIDRAQKNLVIVSAYLKISPDYQVHLRSASRRGVKTVIIYGKTELSHDELSFLSTLDNLQLYYFEHLHAKTYFNEETMVITSMNLYDFSSKNIEVGVLIKRSVDRDVYDKCVDEMEGVAQCSKLISLRKERDFRSNSSFVSDKHYNQHHGGSKHQTKTFVEDEGFCIRCGTEIDHDPSRPYCNDCFYSWNEWKNYDYTENNCHSCGKRHSSTMARPECNACYYN